MIPDKCPLCNAGIDTIVIRKLLYFCCENIIYKNNFDTLFFNKKEINGEIKIGYSHYFFLDPIYHSGNSATEIFIFAPYHIFAFNQINKFTIQSFNFYQNSRFLQYQSGWISDLSKIPRTEEDFRNYMILQ